MKKSIIKVENLSLGIRGKYGVLTLVDNVSFEIKENEILGLVGESGCGKSVTCKAIMGILQNDVEILSGKIRYMDEEVEDVNLNELRGKFMSMVFQEPTKTLHPLKTIGKQIGEVLKIHTKMNRSQIKNEVYKIMRDVGIDNVEKRYRQYPHQLSGGLCQRVIIAIAVALKPSLIIADEPTTALDVTTQKKILKLLKKLSIDRGTSILIVSHDMGVVSQLADRVCVMYCGQIVEEGDIDTIFSKPKHPYNKALLATIPRIDGEVELLEPIPGMVPSPRYYSDTCRFYERCKYRIEECSVRVPKMLKVDNSSVRCIRYESDRLKKYRIDL